MVTYAPDEEGGGPMQRTAFGFLDPRNGRRAPEVFDDTEIQASTRVLGTHEIVVEYGVCHRFAPDAVSVSGHFISMNVDPHPLGMDTKDGSSFQHRTLVPRSFFVQPAGEPMKVRTVLPVTFCAIELPATWTTAVLGRPLEIRPDRGLVDQPLAALMDAMSHELVNGCGTGPMYLDALATAFAVRLARIHDNQDATEHERALDPVRLRRITDHIEATLAERITVHDLAQLAGVSVAHFAREFKRLMGVPPHTFVMQRRVARARQLLAAGTPIAMVATRAGFTDQSHLTRVFRRELGTTPGKLRSRRSGT